MKNSLPKSSENLISIERLKEVFYYDHNLGWLIWLIKPNRNIAINSRAGSLKSDGRRYVRIDNVEYLEHILIWFYMTGRWPKNLIDHKDLNKSNNKWENLREANYSQNGFNCNPRSTNKLGYKGIKFFKGKYRVRIMINGKEIHIGSFNTLEEAVEARNSKGIELAGEFYKIQKI